MAELAALYCVDVESPEPSQVVARLEHRGGDLTITNECLIATFSPPRRRFLSRGGFRRLVAEQRYYFHSIAVIRLSDYGSEHYIRVIPPGHNRDVFCFDGPHSHTEAFLTELSRDCHFRIDYTFGMQNWNARLAGATPQRSTPAKPQFCRSWADFEVAAMYWLREWGYSDAVITSAGSDGGADVIASGAVAQVKAWMVPVGRPEVQQLRGVAHDGRVALFFSLTSYTPKAIEYADGAGVALFRFAGYDGTVEAINPRAAKILASFARPI